MALKARSSLKTITSGRLSLETREVFKEQRGKASANLRKCVAGLLQNSFLYILL